jgi:predicted ferric reductase
MRKLLAFLFLYSLVLVSPLVLSFVVPSHLLEPRPFRDDLASGLAMVAFAAVLMEFFLLGRFRPVSQALGSDLAMQAHQLFARTALVFLLLHPFLYSLWGSRHLPWDTTYAQALRIAGGSWGLFTGLLALGILLSMVLHAVHRASGQNYDRWRLWHGLLALAVLGLGLHHTLESGRYAQLPLMTGFWWVLALLALASWMNVYLLRPFLQARQPMRLSRVTPLARKIWEVSLAPSGGRPLRFAPGQFVWIKLGGIAPHKDHPFSISSAPDPSGSLRFVIKEAGDFTETIPTWRAGALAYVDGPYGDFQIPAEAQAVVMIAGGIGIAPFLGLLAACAQQGETRPIRLIYAERDVTQMVAVEALSGSERLDDFAQILMVEKPHEGWAGMVGRLDSKGFAQALACEAVAKVSNRAHFMICGPSRMMDGVETSLLARGVPMNRVQSEHFQYDFSGRSPKARAIRRGWLALSAVLLLLSVLVTAWT